MTQTLLPDPTTARGPALLIDAKELARLLVRSEASLARDAAAGRIPPPIKLGRSTRWRRIDIEAWLAAGCPRVAR